MGETNDALNLGDAAARGDADGGPAGLGQDHDQRQARALAARPSSARRCCSRAATSTGRPRSSSSQTLARAGRGRFLPLGRRREAGRHRRRARSITRARTTHDVLIVDTAGRLAIDEAMMREIARAARRAEAGRDAVRGGRDAGPGRGQHRARRSPTRCRSPASSSPSSTATRAAARRCRCAQVTGKPIKFAGVGEKLDGARAVPSRPHGLAHPRHGRRAVADRGRAEDASTATRPRSSRRRSSRARTSTSRTSSSRSRR